MLADQKGGAHYLLIPIQSISGIEDPLLWRPDAVNYFAAAWQARSHLDGIAGHAVARQFVGLAVNSSLHRSQDQLHIHIECLRKPVHDALQSLAATLGEQWSSLELNGAPYEALRIERQDLEDTNPFALLARAVPAARRAMGTYTLLVAGMEFPGGPGFIVLAGRTGPTAGSTEDAGAVWAPSGENLLDSRCPAAP